MVSSHSVVFTQIRYLISNITKKNAKGTQAELNQLLASYGSDARQYLLRCLVDQIDFRDTKSTSLKDSLKIHLLSAEFNQLSSRPNFHTLVAHALEGLKGSDVEILNNFCRVLKLSTAQQILVGLAVCEQNVNSEGVLFLKSKLSEVTSTDTLRGLSEGPLHDLLYRLWTVDALKSERTRVIDLIKKMYPENDVPLSLQSLICGGNEKNAIRTYELEKNKASTVSASPLVKEVSSSFLAHEVIFDCGYSATTSVQVLKAVLKQCRPIDDAETARILLMVANSLSGLDDSLGLVYSFLGTLGGGELPTGDPPAPMEGWNVQVLVQTLQETRNPNWFQVMRELDQPIELQSSEGLALIARIFKAATGSQRLPLTPFLETQWDNPKSQLAFLRFATSAPTDVISFQDSRRLVQTLEALQLAKSGPEVQVWQSIDLVERLVSLASFQLFDDVREVFDAPIKNCPEYLLLSLAQVATAYPLRDVLISELLPTYIQMNHPNSAIVVHRLWSASRPMLFNSMTNAYSASPEDSQLLSRFLDLFQEVNGFATISDLRPIPLALELACLAARREFLNLEKWLLDHLEADRRNSDFPMYRSCLNFLRSKVVGAKPQDQANQKIGQNIALSLESVTTLCKCLLSASRGMPEPIIQELQQVYMECVQMQPRLGNVPGGPASLPNQPPEQIFPEEVEQEANAYFQDVYAGLLSVDQAINLLRQFKESKNQHQHSVYACMVHNLLDEYRFFPRYPEKELRITAHLFGQIIRHQLVQSITLGVALRYVLEALKKPVDTKMFVFGITALEEFKERLHDWPQYCMHIYQLPHLREHHPDIVLFIENLRRDGMQLGNPDSSTAGASATSTGAAPSPAGGTTPIAGASKTMPSLSLSGDGASTSAPESNEVEIRGSSVVVSTASKPPRPDSTDNTSSLPNIPAAPVPVRPIAGAGVPPSSSASPSRISTPDRKRTPSPTPTPFSFSTQLDIETLEAHDAPPPPSEEYSDKIHFIFNNLSPSTVDTKVAEFRELARPEHFPYLAQYIVVKRAAIEPNFHATYIRFLDAIGWRDFIDLMMKATYRNIHILLKSEKILTSSSERSLLKNLGSWIGLWTIARNKPVRLNELNLKSLILEAYEYGRLIAVIPFTAKVLDSCRHSKIFKPPNPWIQALMALLHELYLIPELKLTLRFEIEVLTKNIGVDLKEIPQTLLLKDRPVAPNTQDFTSLPAGAQQKLPSLQPLQDAEGNEASAPGSVPATPPPASKGQEGASTPSGVQQAGAEGMIVSNLAQFITISPQLLPLAQKPQLKRLIVIALDHAIRDIIPPVVERSVAISCITTRELVVKDFATEPDEMKMRRAAHLMVQTLTGSLAGVTCKEPLRVSMSSRLRNALQPHAPDTPTLEHAVHMITSENLDVGCAIIEKVAMEKAVRDIDDQLAHAFLVRKQSRDQGAPYHDVSIFAQYGNFLATLPDALLPKGGGLMPQHIRVYEDFALFQRRVPSQAGSGHGSSPQSQSAQPQAAMSPVVQPQPSPPPRTPPITPAPTPAEANELSRTPAKSPGLGGEMTIAPLPAASAQQPSSYSTKAPPMKIPSPENLLQTGENFTTAQVLEKYYRAIGQIDSLVLALPPTQLQNGLLTLPYENEIPVAIRQIPSAISHAVSRDEAALAVAQKVFKRLYDVPESNKLLQEVHLAILEGIRDVCKKLMKELTNWVIYSEDKRKFNKEITAGFLRLQLLCTPDFDTHIAKQMSNLQHDKDRDKLETIVDFSLYLIRACVVERHYVTGSELFNIIEVLGKLAAKMPRNKGPDVLRLLEEARTVTSIATEPQPTLKKHPKDESKSGSGASPLDGPQSDPPGLADQVRRLFEEWARASKPGMSDKAVNSYIQSVQRSGVLSTDETTTRFFRIIVEMSCDAHERASASASHEYAARYAAIDSASKLFLLLVRKISDRPSTRLPLFCKVLAVIARVLVRTYKIRKTDFSQRPFYRFFTNFFQDLKDSSDPQLELANMNVLHAFFAVLMSLRPSLLPGFAFAWLELISHRFFVPKLLQSKHQQGWVYFQELLVEWLRFLEPHLRHVELTEPIRQLYQGTLRVLLVLLHDFPEFLCDYHFALCDAIPPSCVQMRNLVLSAFPRSQRLPDPFTPNLKVDLLPEILHPPRILSDYKKVLSYNNILRDVDSYLKTRKPASFLGELRQRIMLPSAEAQTYNTQYNVGVINALVLHVGIHALQQLQQKSHGGGGNVASQSAPMDIFCRLALDLDPEGRYLFISAIANHLRYPNSHTHYFSCILLYLFAEIGQEVVQEQITRVLLERLVVNRPHPWGLLITFIELIKNPRYNFWSHGFVRYAPEIERLFESVARSCMPSNPSQFPGNGNADEDNGPQSARNSHPTAAQNNAIPGSNPAHPAHGRPPHLGS
eukprot:Rmarinus@m.14689